MSGAIETISIFYDQFASYTNHMVTFHDTNFLNQPQPKNLIISYSVIKPVFIPDKSWEVELP